MTFGKLKTALRVLINRKDFTDELAGEVITRGISDIERELRIGPMERVLETLPYDGTSNSLMVPAGYLELIDIFIDGRQLVQKDKAGLFAETSTEGPVVFAKVADRWLLAPYPEENQVVFLHYYAESPELTTDTDFNVWTNAGFNAALYTAAALAADIYQMEDDVAARFSMKAEGYLQRLQDQDNREVWSGPMNIELPAGAGKY